MRQLLAAATDFAFYPEGAHAQSPDIYLFTVQVSYRAPGLFAVIRMGECWDGEQWVYESLPSNRTDEFKAKTRFPLLEAAGMAQKLANLVQTNGRTYAELQELLAKREAAGS